MEPKKAPKVSVNIPVYNGEKTIARAVRSILSQSFTDFELIIVDDASQDSTARILKEFDDPRITVIRNESNQGISRTRNTALKHSQGDYVMVLDADDISLPDRMKKQVGVLDADPSLDGSFGWCELFTENPDEAVSCFSPDVDPVEMRELILFQNPFYHSSACVRRSVMGYGYRDDLECAEDYAKWLELIFSGKRLAVLREPLIKYWVHNSTHYTWAKMRGNIKKLHSQYFEVLFGRPMSADDAEAHLTLYGLPERFPTSRHEAIALLSSVERWISTIGGLKLRDPGVAGAKVIEHARAQFYLLISQLAPVIGLGVVRFLREVPRRNRLKLLAKSQLPMMGRDGGFQMNVSAHFGEDAGGAKSGAAPYRGPLKKIKQTTLSFLDKAGVSTRVSDSRWRRRRLLILSYHSIPTTDEHLWHGAQFMEANVFRGRMKLLKTYGCTVLPLEEAITRLNAGTLPERAVAITFDDGTRDFYTQALPIMEEFALPVTLYLTTFYTEYNRPVFDLMSSYLLWKSRDKTLDLKKVIGEGSLVDLRSESAREAAWIRMYEFALEKKLTAEQKDEMLISLSRSLGIDYDSLLKQKALHNLSVEEVRELARKGVDIQLHSHRHRTPIDRELFIREIQDNRKSILRMTGKSASHYCYPSGVTNALFLPWLREAGVVSATTCESGLASRRSDPLLLPRLLDTSTLSEIEFGSWLTGISAALPRRTQSKELPGL